MMEVNDFIHGQILIPEELWRVIETPHFQRLKQIKQLGLLYKGVPNATYTRYQHSLGTYFLTTKMLNCLENNSDWLELNVTTDCEMEKYKFYRKAVELAGLLHDVGHGPFSHLWERIAVNYNHEENARDCVDSIFDMLPPEILPEMRSNDHFGIELIKELINGERSRSNFETKFNFLFEIVHNAQCELDVDKLDYLKHDTYFAKSVLNEFEDIAYQLNQIENVFFNARISASGHHIEYRYEDYDKIYKLFEARNQLHIKFYRMPKVMACDYLLKEIILGGDFRIDGEPVTKIRSHHGETFLKLVDEEILRLINNSKLFPYLNSPGRIVQVDKLNIEEIEKDPFIFEVKAVIKGPGAQMPPDERFHFYGNAKLKPTIKRQLSNQNLYECFRLLR